MARRKQDPSTWITVERVFNEDADNGAIYSELFKKILGVDRKFTDVKKEARADAQAVKG